MSYDQTMTALKRAGTAQNRKVYARHGCREPMFGVSFAHLGKLTKQIKTDHALAEGLWKSGNHDARILATMIADPMKLTTRQAQAWAKDLDCYVLADALAKLVGKSSIADEMMKKWISAKPEFVVEAGWVLMAMAAMNGSGKSDEFLTEQLARIEAEIHGAKNRVKHGMIMALIAIGGSRPKLTSKAIAAARRIGPVKVDHGQTGCKTPEPIAYIEKMLKRAERMKAEG